LSLKQKTFKGVVWSGSEKLGIQGIQFILGIILARLLSPKDFGLLGLLTIFIALAQTFIDSGFNVGLVRKKDADDKDFSTVFWFNIIVALISYLLLFIASPYIADFYDQPILKTHHQFFRGNSDYDPYKKNRF
jgi:O-antigen/teichoic acid export membrane protein